MVAVNDLDDFDDFDDFDDDFDDFEDLSDADSATAAGAAGVVVGTDAAGVTALAAPPPPDAAGPADEVEPHPAIAITASETAPADAIAETAEPLRERRDVRTSAAAVVCGDRFMSGSLWCRLPTGQDDGWNRTSIQ